MVRQDLDSYDCNGHQHLGYQMPGKLEDTHSLNAYYNLYRVQISDIYFIIESVVSSDVHRSQQPLGLPKAEYDKVNN